jgi:hypothetical protein
MFKYTIAPCSQKIEDDCWSPEIFSFSFYRCKAENRVKKVKEEERLKGEKKEEYNLETLHKLIPC